MPRPHARETNLKEKWVVNISDRPLSTSEKSALSLNFNFAITPKSLPVPQIVSSIESGIDQLPNAKKKNLIRAAVTSSINNWRPPPRSNITNEEEKALRDLAKGMSVTILPADKGRAIVVMNTNDYVDKINNLLNDEETYHKITDKRRNPTSSTEKSLNKLLLQIKDQPASHDSSKKQLEPKLYYKLHSTDSTPASFYGLPKIHDSAVELTEIVQQYQSEQQLRNVLRSYSTTREQIQWLQQFQWHNLRVSHGPGLLVRMDEQRLYVFPSHHPEWERNKAKL
ncbi:hypothetical protein ACROYT_G013951 [Oculina patagonica]